MKLLQNLHNSMHFSSTHFYTELTEVFVLMYAEFIADGCLNPQTFSESDMAHFRKLIDIHIIRGSINYDV
jgi:Ulp1 family protease